jgi:predicted metal-binding membrane protein
MVATPRRVHSVSFLVMSLLLLVASVMVTVIWGTAMSAMGGMPMPGGWTMSMAWMQMPGQTWTMTAVSFVGMWTVMMVAMMLPSLVPMLRRYRKIVWSVASARLGWLTVCVGAGYFFVWSLFGVAAFSLGVVLAAVEMRQPALARAVPIAAAIALLLAGAFQFSTWKAHHLACCRYESAPVPPLRGDPGSAWGHGVRLGVHCSSCCGNLIVTLLVIGVMDLRAMAIVTVAITAERLAPAGERVARAIGAVCAAAGVVLLARAAGLV